MFYKLGLNQISRVCFLDKKWIVYHLKALDYARNKSIIRQEKINEELAVTKDTKKALEEVRSLLGWYRAQVEYHRNGAIKHLDPEDLDVMKALEMREKENKSLSRAFIKASELSF